VSFVRSPLLSPLDPASEDLTRFLFLVTRLTTSFSFVNALSSLSQICRVISFGFPRSCAPRPFSGTIVRQMHSPCILGLSGLGSSPLRVSTWLRPLPHSLLHMFLLQNFSLLSLLVLPPLPTLQFLFAGSRNYFSSSTKISRLISLSFPPKSLCVFNPFTPGALLLL